MSSPEESDLERGGHGDGHGHRHGGGRKRIRKRKTVRQAAGRQDPAGGGGGGESEKAEKRFTNDGSRQSAISMERTASEGTMLTDRISDGNEGSITGPSEGSAGATGADRAGKQKQHGKLRLNVQNKTGASPARDKSRNSSATKITTGASLIPDLNLVINRMRVMKDDSFVYMDYMLPHDSELFTPYSLRLVEYMELDTSEPFYTVTRHGVTFWHCSENFFTPLDQWQQEFQQFLSIIQIRSFSIFRLWKGFKVGVGFVLGQRYILIEIYRI